MSDINVEPVAEEVKAAKDLSIIIGVNKYEVVINEDGTVNPEQQFIAPKRNGFEDIATLSDGSRIYESRDSILLVATEGNHKYQTLVKKEDVVREMHSNLIKGLPVTGDTAG